MNQCDGGIAVPYGGPLLPLSIAQEDNSLVVNYWVGSAQKWAYTFKIKYRQVSLTVMDFTLSTSLVTGEYLHTKVHCP
ncbi:MAG: hypothetical protein HRT44_13645 [Bdellovibrionales bacterium]|nr:hypothetical protein [Bdellovibrionales bacterium]NQZ20281.1 hypothetical protein [Bdellovibrionales bacterium]